MMKKTSLITLTILVLLSALAVYIYKTKSSTTTLDKEASDFKFKDTASIDKIFIADKEGHSVTLERKKTNWLLNNKYVVRPDILEGLLQTIATVEVKSPVSKNGRDAIIQIMAAKSTKIEIYSKGKKVKQYFVGHNTIDHTGTYMILTNLDTDENYSEPFVTFIPGFEGFLTTRYIATENDWRDRTMINLRPPQIKKIHLELLEVPDSSFVIDLFSMQRFGIKSPKGAIPFDEAKLKQFIAYFQNVNCEYVLEEKDHIVDSLKKSALPFAKLTIYDRNENINVCEFFHKASSKAQNEQYGIDYKYDPDRLYVNYNNGKDWGIAQFYVFGKILQTYDYFLPLK